MPELRPPYRAPDALPPAYPPAAELHLVASTLRFEDLNHPTLLQIAIVTAAPVLCGVLVSPMAALLSCLCASLLVHFWRARRTKHFASSLLRVDAGELSVAGGGRARPIVAPLSHVKSVSLREEAQPAFAIRGHGVRAAELGTHLGRCRVVIDLGDEQITVPEVLIAHSECVEWIPRIHRFLRGQGWTPESEVG